ARIERPAQQHDAVALEGRDVFLREVAVDRGRMIVEHVALASCGDGRDWNQSIPAIRDCQVAMRESSLAPRESLLDYSRAMKSISRYSGQGTQDGRPWPNPPPKPQPSGSTRRPRRSSIASSPAASRRSRP